MADRVRAALYPRYVEQSLLSSHPSLIPSEQTIQPAAPPSSYQGQGAMIRQAASLFICTRGVFVGRCPRSRAKETLPLPGLWPGLAPPSAANPVPSALDPRRPVGRGPRQLSPWRDKIHPPSRSASRSLHRLLHPSIHLSTPHPLFLPPSDIPSSSPIL